MVEVNGGLVEGGDDELDAMSVSRMGEGEGSPIDGYDDGDDLVDDDLEDEDNGEFAAYDE
jgi:hypothetical protein